MILPWSDLQIRNRRQTGWLILLQSQQLFTRELTSSGRLEERTGSLNWNSAMKGVHLLTAKKSFYNDHVTTPIRLTHDGKRPNAMTGSPDDGTPMIQHQKETAMDARKITRRTFVSSSLMGGALAITGPVLPSKGLLGEQPANKVDHPAFPLEEVTIGELQRGMDSGKYTARSLVQDYLSRIALLDKQGPALNQVLQLNPDAIAVADELDTERKAKGPRGPLHGIPILIKDNIGTADRMTTTAGSLALSGSIPSRDAAVAKRLREAGAILLGKTNMSEWANFRSTHSSSGWSGRAGQGRNPYALDRSPSGSSSGSAAAVAANYCTAAIGTETDGSIVSPASACSIVGIKPTVGLVSRSGIIPIAHSQDTAGPMARTVTDAAILLGAVAGFDPQDDAT